MADITTVLNDLKHEDDDERDLAKLPNLDGRLSYHRQRLWTISQTSGGSGVKSYKDKHPEARSIQVQVTTIAYQSKPAGYDDYLAGMATRWLTSDAAAFATNSKDVAALNERFGTSRFNPANHFSKPIGKRTMTKIREAYSARGVPLDAATVKSMSDVRRAAKAAHAVAEAGTKPFGRLGTISGNQLVCGGRVFPVMQHHGHDSIKVAVGGSRSWLRLDLLAAFAEQAGLVSGGDDLLSITSNVVIRDLVPDAENLDFDPLATVEIGDLVPASNSGNDLLIGEMVPDAPPTLSEQMIAARTAKLATALADGLPPKLANSTAQPDDPDADPLAL